MTLGRALLAIDHRAPHPEGAPSRHLKSAGQPHNIDRISAAAGALAADRAIAALIRVGGVAVDGKAHRAAPARSVEMHWHGFTLAPAVSAGRCADGQADSRS